MGEIVTRGLADRQAYYTKRMHELAYERFSLVKRLEEIDKYLDRYEWAIQANDLTQNDIETEEAIANQTKSAKVPEDNQGHSV